MDNSRPVSILILEDDVDFGPLLQDSLELEGYDVALHTKASSAIEHFDNNSIDLIITDLLIKDGEAYTQDGGIKLISEIRQIRSEKLPIIAISGSFAQDQYYAVSTAMTVGATKTLAKPLHPKYLLDVIKQYV